jgi:hypothetical protein
METYWVHFTDITVKEVVTVVKVVRHGYSKTRVLLSNGRNELIPSPREGKWVQVGDTVVMCPSSDGKWDVDRDVAIQTMIRMRKNGLPDYALQFMPSYAVKYLVNVKPEV